MFPSLSNPWRAQVVGPCTPRALLATSSSEPSATSALARISSDMKSKPAHYVDAPFRPWPPLSRPQPNFYFRPPDPIDARNFKTSSSKGSTYSDFSGLSAYSNKSRDYYFLSPSYRSAGAPTPNNHADLYLNRERPRQIRNPNASPACPCSRSRSLEDVRTEVVTEWEDDDENGNRIVAPATKFNRAAYKANTTFEKQNFLTRHSMENLIDRSPQVPPPKRISAFQVIEQLSTETLDSM